MRNLGSFLSLRDVRVTQYQKPFAHHEHAHEGLRLDDSDCKKVVSALVLSQLDYANFSLLRITDTLLKRHQVAKKTSAVRLVSGVKRRESITPAMHLLHLLPVRLRNHLNILFIIMSNAADKSRRTSKIPLWRSGAQSIPSFLSRRAVSGELLALYAVCKG